MKLILPKMPTVVSRVVSATIVASILALAGAGAGLWLFVGGISQRLVDIQNAQGLVQASESQQELIRQSRDALTREKDDIARLEALFVPNTQKGIVSFVESLESVASSTSVTLTVASPQTISSPEGPYAQSFAITMKGRYVNIMNMIALLEQSGALKRFDALEIAKSGEEYQAHGTVVVATQ